MIYWGLLGGEGGNFCDKTRIEYFWLRYVGGIFYSKMTCVGGWDIFGGKLVAKDIFNGKLVEGGYFWW